MSAETAAYYKDSLALMQKDLFGPGGYDEVYILSSKDLQSAPRPSDALGPKTGIAFFDEGAGITQMRDSSMGQPYYNFIKNVMADRTRSLQDAADEYDKPDLAGRLTNASPPSSVAFRLADEGKGGIRHVGVIFLSDTVEPSLLAGALGVSDNARAQISRKDQNNIDDFKKFIVLPHEAGHLIHNLAEGHMLDTGVPLEETEGKSFADRHKGEIHSDEYARNIFDEATKRGLTRNPYDDHNMHSAMDSALNYRTLASVDGSLIMRGGVDIHATSPFMKGAPFHEGGRNSYQEAISVINNGVDHSAMKLMGEFARGEHKNGDTFWSASIRDCFKKAIDDSYAVRKRVSDIIQKVEGKAPDVLLQNPGGISAAFRVCMTGDFSNRYQLLAQQYNTTAPDTPEGQLLGMYIKAAETEIPDEEIDMAHKRPEPQRLVPAMGMKP